MKRAARAVASAAVGLTFMFLCALTISAVLTGCGHPGEEKVPHQIRIEEDSPWWDCATMGNLECRPVEAVTA